MKPENQSGENPEIDSRQTEIETVTQLPNVVLDRHKRFASRADPVRTMVKRDPCFVIEPDTGNS